MTTAVSGVPQAAPGPVTSEKLSSILLLLGETAQTSSMTSLALWPQPSKPSFRG